MPEIIQVENGYKVIYLRRISATFETMTAAIQCSYKMKNIYG